MADTPTQNDLFLVGRREAVSLPTRFDRAIIDVAGSDINVILNVAAAMGEEVGRFLQRGLNNNTISSAEDEELERTIYDRYQLRRHEAQSAVVPLTFTRTGSVGFTIQTGARVGTEDGQIFLVVNDLPFPKDNPGPLTVFGVAERTGTEGNVAANTVVRVLTAQQDDSLTVVNTEPAAGGRTQETPDEFRDRARSFYASVRRGTRRAIEDGARGLPRIQQAQAIEVFQPSGIPTYRVQLFIGDIAGQANIALAQEVVNELDEHRALGVPVLTVPAIPEYVDVVLEGLLFEVGVNTSTVLQLARQRLLAYVNGLRPGATMRRSQILAVLAAVDGLVVPEGALVEPAGDVAPAVGTVIRTTLDRLQLAS